MEKIKKNSKMKNVSLEEMIDIFKKIDGKSSTFVSLVSNTDARLLKRNNPFLGTRKISKVFGMLNNEYGKVIDNEFERNNIPNNFEVSERAYGTKNDEKNGCILSHKGKKYLVIDIRKSHKPKYLYENKLIDKAKIESFFPEKKPNIIDGLKKEIVWRNYDMTNLRKVYLNKQIYKIVS